MFGSVFLSVCHRRKRCSQYILKIVLEIYGPDIQETNWDDGVGINFSYGVNNSLIF